MYCTTYYYTAKHVRQHFVYYTILYNTVLYLNESIPTTVYTYMSSSRRELGGGPLIIWPHLLTYTLYIIHYIHIPPHQYYTVLYGVTVRAVLAYLLLYEVHPTFIGIHTSTTSTTTTTVVQYQTTNNNQSCRTPFQFITPGPSADVSENWLSAPSLGPLRDSGIIVPGQELPGCRWTWGSTSPTCIPVLKATYYTIYYSKSYMLTEV